MIASYKIINESFLIKDIAQLRQKFEEDKKRIESLKTTRKFKPF